MFKEDKVATLRILAALTAILALVASLAGVAVPDLYKPIVSGDGAPFIYGQDVISLVAAALLLAILTRTSAKFNIVQSGIVGYLFYAYTPYVMGTMYNSLYFIYIAILSLSIFYLIVAFVSIQYEDMEFSMPATLRMVIAGYCVAIVVLFAPQWVIAIVNNIQTDAWRGSIGFHYMFYVYILDLTFVLPVCLLTAIFILRKKVLGYVLGGIISMKGFTLMLSVASGSFFQWLFQHKISVGDAVEFSSLSFVFLLLVVFYLDQTKVERRRV